MPPFTHPRAGAELTALPSRDDIVLRCHSSHKTKQTPADKRRFNTNDENRRFSIAFLCLCLQAQSAGAIQIVAGTSEDKMFRRASEETNADSKMAALMELEKQFPHSKVLPAVYLMVIDLYRHKDDSRQGHRIR